MIQEIAADEKQNSTVRMAGLLAIYRAGYPYQTESMLTLLKNETAMEKRLIGILTLRWGNAQAVPVLLGYVEDPNIEIATAAACALVESLRTQLKVAEEIETVRHNEYKRLLGLQGDGIVTAAESQKAYEPLQAPSAETESIREKLRKEEIELRLLTKPGQ